MARLVTQADIDQYGAAIINDGQVPMQINDWIFFLSDRNANGNIFYNAVLTGAREGATIWIQGGPDSYGSIQIGTGSLGLMAPSTFNNPNRICFFGDRVRVDRTANSLAAREIEIWNFNNLIIDFESNTYPGLRDGWGAGKRDAFGLYATSTYISENSMALKVDSTLGTMKRLEIRGCNLSMGNFAKIRAVAVTNDLDRFVIERNLITRSARGEGFYIGSTQSAPWPRFRNMIVRDNIMLFTAAEAIQLQEIADGSRVHNNVIFMPDQDYKTAFQAFQDTGVQLDLIGGDVRFFNNIVIGFGTSGLHMFSKNGSADPMNYTFGNGVPRIFNNVMSRAKKGFSFRIHNSFVHASKIVYRDNDVVSTARNYTDVDTLSDYHYDIDQTTVPVEIIGGKLPNDGFPILNPGESNSSVRYFNITRESQSEPEFVRSGFDGINTDKIFNWGEAYTVGQYATTSGSNIDPGNLSNGGTVSLTVSSGKGYQPGQTIRVISMTDENKYFYGTVSSYSGSTLNLNNLSSISGSGANNQWHVRRCIPFTTEDFVWQAIDESTHPYKLYKCIQAHTGHHTLYPSNAPAYWQVVQWDADGRNMYDPLYNGIPVTDDFMEVAGDFRLVKGTYHHLKGRGLSCNEQRDDQTQYGWQWKQSELGIERDIPGAYSLKLNIADYSYLWSGRYIRFWVRRRKSNGTFENPVYSEWMVIP